MKTIYRELNRIKDFIEEKLEEHNLYMAREPEEGEDEGGLELVHPKVAIGNLPHANFSLYADQAHMYQAPYILVGYETADYGEDSETINILIQACAYTQDVYDAESGFPDNMGTLDITELLEALMQWFESEADFPVEKPYQIGSYASRAMTYPYAFGYLQFTLETGIGTLHQPRFYD